MRDVPTFDLYGEPGGRQDGEFLHVETIQARSRLHDFRIRPHRHEQLFQMLFLSGGSGQIAFDGQQADLAPPCLVLVPPCVVHGYGFSNDVEGYVITLYDHHLTGIVARCPDAGASPSGAQIIPLAEQPDISRAIAASLAALAAEFSGHAPGRVGMMEARIAIVWLAGQRALLARSSAAAAGQGRGRALVGRFRDMVDRDFAQRIPVEDYASRLGVTPVHLRRLCRDHLGTTPLGAINARIVLEARRQLVFTSLGVKEVAASLGFADHAYFSRFFQRETGLAPTAFRATQQRTAPPAALAPALHPADTPPATGRRAA